MKNASWAQALFHKFIINYKHLSQWKHVYVGMFRHLL